MKMKYFIAIALIATVASAAVRPTPVSAEMAELQEIIAAIQSPSTDPATAHALEEMLLDILGIKPIDVGPAIINPVEGISIGPAIIPFPLPDGGAVVEEPIVPAPVIVAPAPVPSASAPLVQIIVNVNQAAGSNPVDVSPVDIAAPEITPDPIHVVDSADWPILGPGHIVINPEQVVETAPESPIIDGPILGPGHIVIDPVQVVETAPESPIIDGPILGPGHIVIDPVQVVEVAPEPVQVVEVAPVPAEPVQIGVPIIPEAAIVLPEQLN